MPGLLQHSPAEVVSSLLILLGQASDPATGGDWPVVISSEPDIPDNLLVVFDTEGRQHGRTNPDSERQEHQGIQIKIRSQYHPIGYLKAQTVATTLDKVFQQLVNVNTVITQPPANVPQTITNVYKVANVLITSGVIVLGKETPTSKRSLFTINGVVSLRQIS